MKEANEEKKKRVSKKDIINLVGLSKSLVVQHSSSWFFLGKNQRDEVAFGVQEGCC